MGYDRSFEQLVARPPIGTDDLRVGGAIELDLGSRRARLERGVPVDLGGIGKGFAAARALWAMRDAWPSLPGGLVDLGGDVAVSGATPDGGPWQIAIADPRTPGATIGTLALPEGAVATSGCDRRRFGRHGELHHLIDPRTRRPAERGLLAVTVVARDGVDAEGYATALAVSPLEDAAALLARRPSLSALLVPLSGDPIVIGDLPLAMVNRPMEVIV